MMKYVFAVAITMLSGAAIAQQTPNAPPAGDAMMQPAPTDPAMAPAPGMQPGGPAQPAPTDMGQPGPVQPGPVQPGPVQPGPVQPGMAQPAPAGESAMASAPAPAAANLPMCSRTVQDSCQQSAAMERRALSAAQDSRRNRRPPM